MFPAGLSPRVRGSQVVLAVWQAGEGSIPAGAGEPAEPTHARLASRVYPRGCGGATSVSIASAGLKGLSPRVRGSLGALADEHAHSGSIPAGAGEPPASRRGMCARWVYPRGCGGARRARQKSPCVKGLSPRVRGSQSPSTAISTAQGSIPAGAGEPRAALAARSWAASWAARVYPRGCGGARSC